MDPEKKSLNCIFPTKYVIPKSLKFCHWPRKNPPSFLNSESLLRSKLPDLRVWKNQSLVALPKTKIIALNNGGQKETTFLFWESLFSGGKLTGSFREGIYFH